MQIKSGVYLQSTISKSKYDISRINERADNGEPLEVINPNIKKASISEGEYLCKRYIDFLPFENINSDYSLGEGNTSLLKAKKKLQKYTNINNLFFKNETQNPTWSFKDRGSLACIWMAVAMDEKSTATISTGNMGNSLAAYGARAGLQTQVFLPHFTPKEKIAAIAIHGAEIYKIKTSNYSIMKSKILKTAADLGKRVVSGNGPIRVEGYKLTAFELYEQFNELPDYIIVPTSACGHIRGLFKGFKELKIAGFINKLPKMIIVQAKNNSPIVKAIKKNKNKIIPEKNVKTIAEAITSGNPYGGNEIIHKANNYNWLAESVSESEIIEAHKKLATSGIFVEPASATSLAAAKKLKRKKLLKSNDNILIMLTGSGMKDFEVVKDYNFQVQEINIDSIKELLQ